MGVKQTLPENSHSLKRCSDVRKCYSMTLRVSISETQEFPINYKGACAVGRVKKRKGHPGKIGGTVGKEMPTKLSVKYE